MAPACGRLPGMVMFGRRLRDTREGIAAFWAWWERSRDEVDAALERDDLRRLHRTLNDRVRGVHPELAWELAPGRYARHALVLSPEGSSALRPVTERWLRAGPGADAAWEYHAARPPNPAAYASEVELCGMPFRPGAARFGVETDVDRARVHVAVWHPDFPRMDDAIRLHASFLLLDWALGEDHVERWLGEVRVSVEEQPDDVAALTAAVAELGERCREIGWTEVDGMDDAGLPVVARLRVPYPRLDHPLFDLHGTIRIPFPTGEEGHLSEADVAALDAMAAGLTGRLGPSAALVAVVTTPTSRTLHLYADADGVVPHQVAAWASQQDRPVHAEWTPDPGWDAVRPLY